MSGGRKERGAEPKDLGDLDPVTAVGGFLTTEPRQRGKQLELPGMERLKRRERYGLKRYC
jgi:hypothetical protein